MTNFFARLPLRRPRPMVVAWLGLVVALTLAAHAAGGSYDDNPTLAGGPAKEGAALLRAHGVGGAAASQVVFASPDGGSVSGAPLDASLAGLRRLPGVVAVSAPRLSRGDAVAVAEIETTKGPGGLGKELVARADRAVAPARRAGLRVDYGGALGQAARPRVRDAASEAIGLFVALAVLLLGFGSVLAALLPLTSAVLGVLAGLGLVGLLSATLAFGSVTPTLATMMGLGVGIDYALFLTTRFRQRLLDGDSPEVAVSATLRSSGRAVLVAALTVVVALCGLYASGFGFVGRLGLGAALAVALAALAALSLVPALLRLVGTRIDRFTVRRPVAEPRGRGGRLTAYVGALERHPWAYAALGIALLGVLAVPALSLRFAHLDSGSEPTGFTERRAYDEVARAFGPGANGPLTVAVAPATGGGDAGALGAELRRRLAATAGVAAVDAPRLSPDGEIVSLRLTPAAGPADPATEQLLVRLRDRVLPAALADSGARGFVTGTTAAQIEVQDAIARRLPTIVLVVAAAALVLLLASFGSPVLALKAALLNLLSIGASFGVVVAVFQWGWGAGLLGLPGPVPIEAFVPMMMFTIVFGLSMDYEVFLLSRVREEWLGSRDNGASVAAGLAATARVIGCAAAIMASVFLAFLVSDSVVVKMLALGLGVSVIVDATVIRLLVVPALMFTFGRLNWWQPRWLRWAG